MRARRSGRGRAAFSQLGADPFRPRPGADILPLRNTSPPKHRLRIGDLRMVYRVDRRRVMVIEMFSRGRGYRSE